MRRLAVAALLAGTLLLALCVAALARGSRMGPVLGSAYTLGAAAVVLGVLAVAAGVV